MIKSTVPAILAAVSLCLSVTAFGTVIVYDNFDYPDGSLIDNPGWANHSGTSGDLLVSGGQAVVQHGAPSEDANLAFASVSGDIFFGIDFSVDDLGAAFAGTDNEYFAHFKDDAFSFVGRLDIVEPTDAGDYTVGIATFGGAAEATWATDLTYGTVYRAVVRYDQDANQAQLWINASSEADTSILGIDQDDPGTTVTQFALRQSDSSENETVRVDGVVVGTTFADVATAIPEPSTLVLAALGLAGLALRRRR